jgi:hypothetical protein
LKLKSTVPQSTVQKNVGRIAIRQIPRPALSAVRCLRHTNESKLPVLSNALESIAQKYMLAKNPLPGRAEILF